MNLTPSLSVARLYTSSYLIETLAMPNDSVSTYFVLWKLSARPEFDRTCFQSSSTPQPSKSCLDNCKAHQTRLAFWIVPPLCSNALSACSVSAVLFSQGKVDGTHCVRLTRTTVTVPPSAFCRASQASPWVARTISLGERPFRKAQIAPIRWVPKTMTGSRTCCLT